MPDSAPPVVIVSSRRRLVVLVVICAVFTAMGVAVLVLAPTKTLNVVVGSAAIAFFGIGGGGSFITQWRRSREITADDEGLRFGDGARVRWNEVDRIGSTPTMLGIRLRRYDGFLASLPRGSEHTATSLRASRAANSGWDLVWPQRLLDRPPGEAARDLQRRRPSA